MEYYFNACAHDQYRVDDIKDNNSENAINRLGPLLGHVEYLSDAIPGSIALGIQILRSLKERKLTLVRDKKKITLENSNFYLSYWHGAELTLHGIVYQSPLGRFRGHDIPNPCPRSASITVGV